MTNTMPDFGGDLDIAAMVANRFEKQGGTYFNNRMTFIMDMMAMDSNGNPRMDWIALLEAPKGDFMHDAYGICGHMNRSTGQLGGCFLPRCARSD